MRLPNEYVLIDSEFLPDHAGLARMERPESVIYEVVQVGALHVVRHTEVVAEREWFLHNTRYPVISEYFTELTGITREKIERQAVDMSEVLGQLFALTQFGQLPVLSYGNDLGMLLRDADTKGIAHALWDVPRYEVKEMLAPVPYRFEAFNCGITPWVLGLRPRFRPHNALHDCRNLLQTLEELWRRGYLRGYEPAGWVPSETRRHDSLALEPQVS